MSNDLTKLKSFLIPILRRGTYRWKERTAALKAARKDRGIYECALCKGLFKQKETVLDHINPVVDPKTGFTNWDDYINKMFCDADGYQVICKSCNEAKTTLENELRKMYRAQRKEDDGKLDKVITRKLPKVEKYDKIYKEIEEELKPEV